LVSVSLAFHPQIFPKALSIQKKKIMKLGAIKCQCVNTFASLCSGYWQLLSISGLMSSS
jgi:hypothetical protein